MEVTRSHASPPAATCSVAGLRQGLRQPPRLALLVLALSVPRDLREYIAGDLHEEFVRRGRNRAWFWREVLRSCPCFMATPRPALIVAIVAVSIIAAVHTFWTFVLSQVPFKADPATLATAWRMFQ